MLDEEVTLLRPSSEGHSYNYSLMPHEFLYHHIIVNAYYTQVKKTVRVGQHHNFLHVSRDYQNPDYPESFHKQMIFYHHNVETKTPWTVSCIN